MFSNYFALPYGEARTIMAQRQAFETRGMRSCQLCEFRSAALSGNDPPTQKFKQIER
jgi:hypothetical protein